MALNHTLISYKYCKTGHFVDRLQIRWSKLLARTMYRAIHKLCPPYLSSIFSFREAVYCTRSGSHKLKLIQPKTNYGIRSLTYRGAKLWNELDYPLSTPVSIDIFKCHLNGNPSFMNCITIVWYNLILLTIHTYWMKSHWSWIFLTLHPTPPTFFLIGLCIYLFLLSFPFFMSIIFFCIDVRWLSLLFTCIVCSIMMVIYVCIWLLWFMYACLIHVIGPLWRTAFGWIGQSNPWVVNK